jgi:hypothetical protein
MRISFTNCNFQRIDRVIEFSWEWLVAMHTKRHDVFADFFGNSRLNYSSENDGSSLHGTTFDPHIGCSILAALQSPAARRSGMSSPGAPARRTR